MLDELKRMAIVTSGVAELTRARAEQVVKDLVKHGDVRKDQASSVVKDLLKRSEQNRKDLTAMIGTEIKAQVAKLGLASQKDVDRLERRVARMETATKKNPTTASKGSGRVGGRSTGAQSVKKTGKTGSSEA